MSTGARPDSLLCVGRTVEEVFGGGEDAEVLWVRPVLHVPAELHHVLSCQERVLPAQQQRASELSQGEQGRLSRLVLTQGPPALFPVKQSATLCQLPVEKRVEMVALTQRGSRNRLI